MNLTISSLLKKEYNASDGALEPGRSYGGACCNTLLKVVYDAANEASGAAQSAAAAQALFDDDEDEDDASFLAKSYKSGFSMDYGCQNTVSVTWADLLRQMKAEFKEIGYAQVPKVTTTRKLDLNKPFSLFPENFDPAKNKKRSLLIGCNYSEMPDCELKACHDDVRSMKVRIAMPFWIPSKFNSSIFLFFYLFPISHRIILSTFITSLSQRS